MKSEIYYNNFIAIVDDKCRLLKIEIRSGADISNLVNELIEFLNVNEINRDYTIKFNGKKIVLNKNSNPANVVNEYLGKTDLLV